MTLQKHKVMTKHDTTLLFVTYTGTSAGTAMAKAIKEYARKEFEDTIIDEPQHKDVLETLLQLAEDLATANPKWKRSKISIHDNTCGGAYLCLINVYWLRVDGETVLTMRKAKGNYAALY